ncbi:hypothetical protein BTE48_01835 [Oceanospirillum multiglobuliferum]|uniref:VWFA domain-containing protein n=1 Tax=Oceanospirillum multiglobuliferum TaxID=64969 RepID=A0A1V4T9J8_9GAMM|nr:hypothetical protein BTE48_01835 [Oceanospirillum multiglobuliferum]
MNSFHFVRPALLWCLPVLLFLLWLYFRVRRIRNPWQQLMRADLQQQLLLAPQQQSNNLLWTMIALSLTVFAVAGPSWSQQSRPVFAQQDALVIVQDLSLSMLAADTQPNRITRSKQKISDLLQQRQEGLTALVVYAGDAHTVTPLTQDSATISSLLPALDPLMMPKLGSAAESGIQQALALFRNAGINKGRILLISDGIDQQALKAIPKLLNQKFSLKILAVGSLDGAPIPLPNNSFAKDDSGNVIISKLDLNSLQQLADSTGADLQKMSLTDRDIERLLAGSTIGSELIEQDAKIPLWIEQGHWFLLPVLPLAALVFRRGWLLSLFLCTFISFPLVYSPKAHALSWPFSGNPVEEKQQAGEKAFAEQRYQEASEQLQQPLWQGSAYYRLGEYEQAAQAFAKEQSADAHYNRGNALARAGQYQDALAAYQQALDLQPEFADAEHNQKIVQQLLEEQQKQQAQDNPQDQQQSQNQEQNQDQGKQNATNDADQNQQNQNGQDQQSPMQPKNQAGQQDQSKQNQAQSEQDSPQQASQNKAQTEQASDQPEQTAPDEQPAPDTQQPTESAQTEGEPENKSEEQRALEQWLRRVPDDPSGLLKRKFEYQSSLRDSPLSEGRSPW